MLLTKHADYSVRVLMYLARRPGEKVPIAAIADAHRISRNHLMKVSQHLARHGYIIGYRGKGGGIALARPARTINLAQVLGKVEHGLGPGKAADGAARDNDDGNFRRALEDAREAFLAALAAYTLADLIAEAGPDELAVRSCGEG